MKPLYFVTYLSLFLGLCACDPDSDATPESGGEYEVVVVMNNIAWDGNAGALIRAQLSTPIPFLQQAEPSMNFKYVIPEQFNDSTKYARNILIVTIDKIQFPNISSPKITRNKWIDDQVIIYLNAPDEQTLEAFLTANRTILTDHFINEEMKRTGLKLAKSHSNIVLDETKKKFDITIFASADIISCKDTAGCLWFSNNAATGRTDLLIYSFPYENKETLSVVNLINKRDSIAKIMIPGFKAGTYMTTNRNNVNYSTTTIGKYCAIIHGLWYLQGDPGISGPFVCYARADELNKRVVVTEGFVYEPVREKRNYIRTLETTLQTVRFPDEQEPEIKQ
ncbi:MAG: DUF4837 family protein [Tannerella sp.]|jgi:hypothetical protein|nr:DUF4837 family protein [Tannerella sp.]